MNDVLGSDDFDRCDEPISSKVIDVPVARATFVVSAYGMKFGSKDSMGLLLQLWKF